MAHMQFLAARSLWTKLELDRYSIPLETSRHIASAVCLSRPCISRVNPISVSFYCRTIVRLVGCATTIMAGNEGFRVAFLQYSLQHIHMCGHKTIAHVMLSHTNL